MNLRNKLLTLRIVFDLSSAYTKFVRFLGLSLGLDTL